MGRRSPFVIELSGGARAELQSRVRRHRAEQRDGLRARVVLMAADGYPNVVIAAALAIAPNTVLKWRKRYHAEGLGGLADHSRSGRPRV